MVVMLSVWDSLVAMVDVCVWGGGALVENTTNCILVEGGWKVVGLMITF